MTLSKIANTPLADLIKDLASKTPSPGGGAATAITGSLAAACSAMAFSYCEDNEEAKTTFEALTNASKKMILLADKDAMVYKKFSECRTESPEAIKEALLNACKIPLQVAELAASITEHIHTSKHISKKTLLPDLQVATILAEAAAESALINIKANTQHYRFPKEKTNEFTTAAKNALKKIKIIREHLSEDPCC